jgi:hypothetical protein
MKSVTLKVKGLHEVILGRFPLFHGAKTMSTNLFPNPFGKVVHNYHLVLREKKKEKSIQIGHHM